MRIVRQTLPRDVQSRYYERSGVIVIDPAKVPASAEDEIIAQSILYATGHEDLAPYASRPAGERHLAIVPEPRCPAADEDENEDDLADGVG